MAEGGFHCNLEKNWSGEKVFGGDSGGIFPGCFSVLNRVFQKEVSNA